MKNLITYLCIFFSLPLFAQWYTISTNSPEMLNDVYCITQDIVVVVGNNGTILKTTDGGTTWVQKTSGTDYNLTKVQFPSANVGYAIGEGINNNGIWINYLIKTIDGGDNWTLINLGEELRIYDLSCINETTLYINTDNLNNQSLRKTIDGGLSFQIVSSNNNFSYNAKIQFINDLTGFASGEYKTTNGGINWSTINSYNIASFSFLNENIGFINAYGEIYKTLDGGLNYIYLGSTSNSSPLMKTLTTTENVVWGIPIDCLLNGSPCFSIRGEIVDANNFQITTGPAFRAIHFANPTNGYAIGIGGYDIFKNTTGTMLGVNEASKKQNLTIYPNPATSQITVSLTEITTQSFEIEITNMLGKKVYSQYYQPINNVSIDTKAFSKGVYFLTVIQQEKKETQKIIID